MTGKSAFTLEVAKKRHAEQVYRARLRDRYLAQHFLRHHPGDYEAALKKVERTIRALRGPLPGSRHE